MPTNKVVDIILNGNFDTDTVWTKGAGTVISGNAAWTGTGATPELVVSQPTTGLVEGRTYKVYVAVTNTSFAAGDTYVGIQLAGGTAYTFTEDQVWDASAPLYLVAGASVSSGIEIISVDGTAADTMTIDDVAVFIEQFTESTNLDAVFVSGDIRVPAGGQLITNGTFDTDFTGWTAGSGSTLSVASGQLSVTLTGGDTFGNAYQAFTTIVGKTYLFNADIVSATAVVSAKIDNTNTSSDPLLEFDTVDSHSGTFIAENTTTYVQLATSSGADSSAVFDNVSVYELTTGPIDEYPWDSTTDYSAGVEALGILNGERVYKSTNTHADGSGGADVNWYTWATIAPQWIISQNPGTVDSPRWSGTSNLISNYFSREGPPPTTGTATVTYGPTNASGGSRGRLSGGGRYQGFYRPRHN